MSKHVALDRARNISILGNNITRHNRTSMNFDALAGEATVDMAALYSVPS